MAVDLPTVLVVNPAAKSGFTRINAEDFDPQRHQLYEPEATPAQGATDAADSRGRDRPRDGRQLRKPR